MIDRCGEKCALHFFHHNSVEVVLTHVYIMVVHHLFFEVVQTHVLVLCALRFLMSNFVCCAVSTWVVQGQYKRWSINEKMLCCIMKARALQHHQYTHTHTHAMHQRMNYGSVSWKLMDSRSPGVSRGNYSPKCTYSMRGMS